MIYKPRRSHIGRPVMLGALVLASLATGCVPILGSYARMAGDYEGSITVQGQEVAGTLTVTQEGRALSAVFNAEGVGLRAEGGGEMDTQRSFRLTVSYDFQCPGEAVLSGSVSGDGRELQGTLEAGDCTRETSGTFLFNR